MSTNYPSTGNYQATIPTLADSADINQAFKDYHDDIVTFLDLKAPSASPTFSGTVNMASATVSLPAGSITTTEIATGTILDADINASAAIAKTKISGTAITLADTGVITSSMIVDGTIIDADIASNALIAQSKVSGLTTDLAAKAPIASPTFTGTITGTLSGTATNATNAVNYNSGYTKITVASTAPSSPAAGDVWIQV